jgi:hypothetical protein
MMAIDPTKAAACWSMIHDRRQTMAATAKALSVGTLDVGDMLIAHKPIVDAEATARATKAGVAAAVPLASVADIELAQRERILGTARRLLAESVESEAIAERLDVPRRTITEMPEARERHAAVELQRAADRRLSGRLQAEIWRAEHAGYLDGRGSQGRSACYGCARSKYSR